MSTRVLDKPDLIRTVLRGAPLFSRWTEEQFATLMASAQLWRYAKGETVYQAAEHVRGVCVIAEGTLLNGRILSNGKEMAIAILRPGWPLLIVPALDGIESPYSATARCDVLVIWIPRATFLAVVQNDIARLRDLMEMMTRQIRQDIESLQSRVASSLRCLMAKYLAYLSRPSVLLDFEAPTYVDPTASDVTQDEMAAMLGTARQTVNRLMKAMERDGILVREGNTIRVINFLGLLAIMEEDEPIHPLWREQIVGWHEKLTAAAAPAPDAKDSAATAYPPRAEGPRG